MSKASSSTAVSAPPVSTGKSFVEVLSQGRNEPEWLRARRVRALEAFQNLPGPTLADEEWRRTDLRAFKLDAFLQEREHATTPQALSAAESARKALSEHYSGGTATLDGRPLPSPTIELPDGALLLELNEAATRIPQIIEKYLMTRAVDPSSDKFSALHGAAWTSGVCLYVPKGVRLEAPLYHLVGLSSSFGIDLNHTLVILEEGAEATLVQETASFSEQPVEGMHCGAVELFLGTRSKLRFVNIQNWSPLTWHFSRERAMVGRNAELQWTIGALGSRLSKVNQEVLLEGEGASAQVNGVMFTTGRQHLAYFTRQDHAARNTRSDLLYKGGLMDKSRVVWKGMIRVEKGAQKTDAYQKNDNLVLSDGARADSIPGLEIEANDVRCTHGATAGRVDEEMVFYAQSRGVDRATAVRLIVEGFFANVYDRISLEPVRETLRSAVAQN